MLAASRLAEAQTQRMCCMQEFASLTVQTQTYTYNNGR